MPFVFLIEDFSRLSHFSCSIQIVSINCITVFNVRLALLSVILSIDNNVIVQHCQYFMNFRCNSFGVERHAAMFGIIGSHRSSEMLYCILNIVGYSK